jgi:2-polyprenyl-6-methoxyphenol hydroxylase-like FAD-dependent oxidoreductase
MGKRRALVIGGSVGGLFAANLLRRAGWDAVVFERVAEGLSSRGAGLGTHPQLSDVLRRIGIVFDDTMGVRVETFICLDRDRGIIATIPGVRIMTSWGRLYRALRAALPAELYRLDKALVRYEQTRDGVTAIFADGSRETGDILIGADGMRSTVREQMFPDLQPSYAGYIAWRAYIDETDVPPDVHRALFEIYTFCLPAGEMMLSYAVPGKNDETVAGRRAYNMMWYRPVDEKKLADLCTDASGRQHGMAIAPPLIRPDNVAEVKADARALLPAEIGDAFSRMPQPFFQAIFDMESPRMVDGRVALLGDAAFVVRPHVGAGVTKAALDAACLADALAASGDGIDMALAQYDRRQSAFGRTLVRLSRDEGEYYIGTRANGGAGWRRMDGERDIGKVMLNHILRSEQIAAIEEGKIRA